MRSRASVLGLLLASLVFAIPAPPAHAEDPSAAAAEFFRSATQAFERGDFRAAALAFEEADRRAPRPITIYNAGLSWDEAGDKPRAADGYREALDRGSLPDTQLEHAKERLAALEKELGLVRVRAPASATVTLAHAVRRRPPASVHILPAAVEVRVEEPGRADRSKRVDVAAGAVVDVAFEDQATPPRAPAATELVPDRGISRTWGWLSLGGAAVATGAGIALGAHGLDVRDEYDRGKHMDAGLRDDAITFRTAANVAFGGAVVLGVVGAVILITGGERARPASRAGAAR